MTEFSEDEIAREAYRLWEAEGRPLWSHAYDHWFRAVESLRRQRSGERDYGTTFPLDGGDVAR